VRIAVVTSLVAAAGGNGEDIAVLDQCALLTEAGHEVRLITRSSDLLRGSLGYHPRAALTIATGRGPSPLQEIQEFAPDVVHVHNTYPNYGRSWVRNVTTPLVVTLHSFRFFCARATFFRDEQVCTECVTVPFSAVRHGCYESKVRSLPYSVAGLRRRSDPLLQRADRIVVLNPRMRGYLAEAGFDTDRIVVGSNTASLTPVEAVDGSGGAWLFAGRLTRDKGILRLLEQWPEGHRLIVIGDGAAMEQAQALAGPNVTLSGTMDRHAVVREMSHAIGLIVPSLSFEGMPLVYLEALAAGLPVIAYEPNAAADLVRQDGTGMAVTWDQPLMTLLDAARESFPALSNHCRDVFASKYSPARYVRGLEAVYADAITAYAKAQK
jgi:glycosyltransferase involved in cell wall biosynthesis